MEWQLVHVVGTPPSARAYHSASVVGQKIFVFGGLSGNTRYDDLWVLDVSSGEMPRWYRPDIDGTPPEPRAEHTAAVLGKSIWIFGGRAGNVLYNDVHILDTEKMRWEKVKSTRDTPSPRYAHSCSLIDKRMYIIGGYNSSRDLNDVYVLDTESLAWTKMEVKGTPPSPRSRHTTSVVGTSIVLFGGFDGGSVSDGGVDGKSVNNVHVLDTENETWIPLTLSGSIPAPRNACSATVINNKIFIFGGSVSWNSKEGFSDVNVLELGKEQLFTKPKVIGESPCARYGHSASILGNRLVVFGGDKSGSARLNDVWILDTAEEAIDEYFHVFDKYMRKHLLQFVGSCKFSDCTLITSDKHQVPAHRIVLASRCKKLAERIYGKMPEAHKSPRPGNADPIKLEIDAKSDVVTQFLEYLYSGQVRKWKIETVVQLHRLASEYDIAELREMCEYHVQQIVSRKNFSKLIKSALDFSSPKMESFCAFYVAANHEHTKDTYKQIKSVDVLQFVAFNATSQAPNPFAETVSAFVTRPLTIDRTDDTRWFADTTIITADRKIYAHAIILSRNDYFKSALSENFLEGGPKLIDFRNNPTFQEASVLDHFVSYLYDPQTLMRLENKSALMFGAKYFLDEALLEYITSHIAVSSRNIWDLLQAASALHDRGLQTKCMAHLAQNPSLVFHQGIESITDPLILIEITRTLAKAKQ